MIRFLLGGAPGKNVAEKARLALLRALRTFLQGVAGAFPAAGAGTIVLTAGYWEAFGYAVLAAAIGAAVSFLQNVAGFLPTDPTQKQPEAEPAAVPAPAGG